MNRAQFRMVLPKKVTAFLLCLFSLTQVYSQTQTRPDAGDLLRQQTVKPSAASEPANAPITLPSSSASQKFSQGPTVYVSTIVFKGNVALSDELITALLSPYFGRSLTLADLRNVAAELEALYVNSGFLAKVTIPPQSADAGVVRFDIQEAVFGRVIQAAGDVRLSPDRASKVLASGQVAGDPVSIPALERSVLLLDDLPGVRAEGALKEGDQPGQTDLLLKMSSSPILVGAATLDNAGNRSSGSNRTNISVLMNSALGMGEQVQLNGSKSQGASFLRLGLSAPVLYDGLRLSTYGSRLDYRLVSQEFAALQIEGSAKTLGLEATYPLVRTRLKNLYVSLGYESREFRNLSGADITSQYRVKVGSAGINGSLVDKLGGINTAALLVFSGKTDLEGSPNQSADAAGANTQGHYTKQRLSVSRLQTLPQGWFGFASAQLQRANKNLDSSERFSLGGLYGVRAYPAGEAPGTQAALASLELRKTLFSGLNATAFYDWGRINAFKDNSATQTPLNSYSLKGAGVSLSWDKNLTELISAQVRATLARRLGSNPGQTLDGKDQDGSKDENRLWLDAGLFF